MVGLHELRVSDALVDEGRLANGHFEEFLHGLSVRGDLSSPRFITHIELAELIQVGRISGGRYVSLGVVSQAGP